MTGAPHFPVDLHAHTSRSDGNDTPRQLIDEAGRMGMHAVAITDHDIPPTRRITLADGSAADAVDYAEEQGVKLLLGIEYSCDTQVDDVHILGFGMAWDHPQVAAECEAAKESKTAAYRELCDRLNQHGRALSWEDDVLHYTSPDGSMGERQPDEVQRKHIFEALAARGHARSWKEAKLLVRDSAQLNVRRRKIDPVTAIELIHEAGGIAILAHPYLIDPVVQAPGVPDRERHSYIMRLFEAGLDGIEARYTYDKTSYKGSATPRQIAAEVRERYRDCSRIISGGSDYHGEQHKGVANPRTLGEQGLSLEEFNAAFEAFGPREGA